MNSHEHNLIKNMAIIAMSILIAIILIKTRIFANIMTSSKELELLGSFIAGIFFTSVFTIAPAMVVLTEIAQVNSVLLVAIFGGLGAMIGDLIIFRFVKEKLSEDILYLLKKSKSKRLMPMLRLKTFKWLMAFLGALIIASPLPDELGLFMLGFVKVKTSLFIPISFLFNSLGILIIGIIAKAII